MDKAELVVFRITPDEKKKFIEACKAKGITASEALRNFTIKFSEGSE